jgi:pyruvate dehydrogenase E2 component (dihydrolipoamide acetyltransferase)
MPPPEARPPRRRVSPLAQKRAEALGVDLERVVGTGPDGTVVVADVEAARVTAAQPMRRAIAAAMSRSKREIPHYYLATDIEVRRLLDWLSARNAERPVRDRLLVVAPLLRAVALALERHPTLNGRYVDGAFQASPAVHLGVAIALRQGGLVAPAIHDAGRKPVDRLMVELVDLIRRVRSGSVRSSELADPTVTVTSLGETGVNTVFGVIFPPQVALIGLGRVLTQPWVVQGTVAPCPVITATLSADHRVSDGHEGARFLGTLERLLAEPDRL